MKKHLYLLLIPIILLGACRNIFGKRVQGDGNIQTVDRPVNTFKDVEVGGAAQVVVAIGDKSSVKIEGDANLLPYMIVSQEDDKIIIREKHGFHLIPTGHLKVFVTAPVFREISASGACDILSESRIVNSGNISLHVSGAGDINMELDAPKVVAEVTGSGNINLKGQTKDVSLELTGAAHAHCYDLQSENTKVNISGAGSAEVYASVKLDAEVSGAGSVRYRGNASNVSQNVSGAGSVNKVD